MNHLFYVGKNVGIVCNYDAVEKRFSGSFLKFNASISCDHLKIDDVENVEVVKSIADTILKIQLPFGAPFPVNFSFQEVTPDFVSEFHNIVLNFDKKR